MSDFEQMASTATKFGMSSVSKATSITTNMMSKTANLSTNVVSQTANFTNIATFGGLNAGMGVVGAAGKGVVGVSKEATALLFTSVSEQIPGFERDKTKEEIVKERPPPVMGDTAWTQTRIEECKDYTVQRELDSLVTEVDQEVSKLIQEAGAKLDSVVPASKGPPRPPMHGLYLKALSCLVIPARPGDHDEVDLWMSEDFKQLRDRCGKCGKRERVTESMHDLVNRYLENAQGKEAIMAGLNARLAVIDKDPFLCKDAFMRAEDYEEWKEREKNSIDSQKVILKRYVKKDIVATVHELKMGNRSSFLSALTDLDETEQAMAQLSAEDRRRIQEVQDEWDAVPEEDEGPKTVMEEMAEGTKEKMVEAKQTLKGYFGQVKMFMNPLKTVTQQVAAPVKAVAKKTMDKSVRMSTGGMVTGDMVEHMSSKMTGIVKQQVIGKAQIWVTMSFGSHSHSSEQLEEQTTGDEAVCFQEGHVQWHLEPGERGAFKVCVYRKSKFGLSTNLKGKEEVVGTVVIHWDDLVSSGDAKQALEQWFECEEEKTRQVRCTIRLITSAIEGSEIPIFDPRENLSSVFNEFFAAMRGPEAHMLRSPAVDWLLENMRIRCGVSASFERLLGLSLGLQLDTSEDLTAEAARSIREERLVQLLDYVKQGPYITCETAAERALTKQTLEMIRKRLRNEIINFPYKYVRGDEGCNDEPALMSMLLDLEEETTNELKRLAQPLPPSTFKPQKAKPAVVVAPKPAAKAPSAPPKAAAKPSSPAGGLDDLIMGISDDAFANFGATTTQGGYTFSNPVAPAVAVAVTREEPPAPQYPTMPKFEKHASTPVKLHDQGDISVLRTSVMRFAQVYYGDEIAAALKKCGMPLPSAGGQLGCKQIKRMAKKVHIGIVRLEECMSGVIPHELIVECVAKLIDMLTIDIAGIIAAYHVSNQMYPDNEASFEEGSDEQLLLKLHHRANMILATVQHIDEHIDVMALATATAPVLKAWVLNMRKIMFSWMQTACGSEQWERIGDDVHHSHSAIDVFASAHQSVETFAALKMGHNSSVRSSFLQCLGDVCCRYMECMHEAAQHEQDTAAAEAKKRADKTGSMAGMMSHMGGAVVGDIMSINKSDFSKITALLTGNDDGDGQGRGQEGEHGDDWSKKGHDMMGKMENMADGVMDGMKDYTKWGSGLKNLGKKSLAASMSVTKKTVNVAQTVGSKTLNVAATATAMTVEAATLGTVHLPEGQKAAGPKKIFSAKDFYDGSQLVKAASCTRMTNSCIVKEQMDQMVTRLEAAEKQHGVVALNDWTLSDQVTKAYERIKQSIQETFELELGPLLRQVHNGIRAALTDEGGTPPVGSDRLRVGLDEAEETSDALAPALQAIVDALENNLGILRTGLNDKNFLTCLRIIWLSSIDVLETAINQDMSGDVRVVKRALSILGQLRDYMHADGAGVPNSLIEKSSGALQKMLEASL